MLSSLSGLLCAQDRLREPPPRSSGLGSRPAQLHTRIAQVLSGSVWVFEKPRGGDGDGQQGGE